MSFSNMLNRLREALNGQRGRNGDVVVSVYDLRDLLNDYDRINSAHQAKHNESALHSITDKQVKGVARAFWRRIYPFRNDYLSELPEKLPVQFFAHMATALTIIDDKRSVYSTDENASAALEVSGVIVLSTVDVNWLRTFFKYQINRNKQDANIYYGGDVTLEAKQRNADRQKHCLENIEMFTRMLEALHDMESPIELSHIATDMMYVRSRSTAEALKIRLFKLKRYASKLESDIGDINTHIEMLEANIIKDDKDLQP